MEMWPTKRKKRMTLPENNYTLSFIKYTYIDKIGPILEVEKTYYKRRFLWFRKKIRKIKYYWRPTQHLLDRNRLKYIEYGNNKNLLGNIWYEIKSNEFPKVNVLERYEMRKIPLKSRLTKDLTMLYSIHVLLF